MRESTDHPPLLLTTTRSIRILDVVQSDIDSNRFEDARHLLRKLWKRNDGMIAAAYYRTDIAMREAINSGSEDLYRTFFDESITFRRLIRRAPMSAGVDYLRGESERQLFIVHAARGENIRAAFALRTSLTISENLTRRHPEFVESYGTLGLMHITLATIPYGYQQLFSVLGMSGSVEQGISELELAATGGRYAASEAREMLAILSRHEVYDTADVEAAIVSLHSSHSDLPMSGLILGDILLRSRRSREVTAPVMPVLPDQHQLLSGNVAVDFPAIYSSDG